MPVTVRRAREADADRLSRLAALTFPLACTVLLAEAAATEARGAWLGVSEENARANAFYARHGFVPVGRKRFHLGDVWEDDVVRERALRTPSRSPVHTGPHPVHAFCGQRPPDRLPSLPDPALGAPGRPSGESLSPAAPAACRPRRRSA